MDMCFVSKNIIIGWVSIFCNDFFNPVSSLMKKCTANFILIKIVTNSINQLYNNHYKCLKSVCTKVYVKK